MGIYFLHMNRMVIVLWNLICLIILDLLHLSCYSHWLLLLYTSRWEHVDSATLTKAF